jgi:hypothetical protein
VRACRAVSRGHLVAGGVDEGLGDAVVAAADGVPLVEAVEHDLLNGAPGRQVRLLGQIGGAHLAPAGDLAAVRQLDASQDPAERALSRAVRAHQAHALATANRERDVLEDRARAVVLAEIRGVDDGHGGRMVLAGRWRPAGPSRVGRPFRRSVFVPEGRRDDICGLLASLFTGAQIFSDCGKNSHTFLPAPYMVTRL